MYHVLRLACGVLLCGLTMAAGASAESRALLVGIGKYKKPGHDLPGIDKDLVAARQIAMRMGFRGDQIRVLADREATLNAIRSGFRDWLYQATDPGDRALFYFSGHGSYLRDASGDETDLVDEMLIPHDFDARRGRVDNALIDDELGALLDDIPTRNVYVMLDACHSGTATRELGVGEYVGKFLSYEGMPVPSREATRGMGRSLGGSGEPRLVLTAASESERALASKLGGLFTLGVAVAFEEAEKKGIALAPQELRDFTETFVAYVLQKAPEKMHHPQLYGSSALMGIDLRSGSSQVAATPAPTAAEPPPAAPAPAAPAPAAPAPAAPATVAPAPAAPAPAAPATVAPATVAPATVAPATVAPATVAPATVAPATVAPAEPVSEPGAPAAPPPTASAAPPTTSPAEPPAAAEPARPAAAAPPAPAAEPSAAPIPPALPAGEPAEPVVPSPTTPPPAALSTAEPAEPVAPLPATPSPAPAAAPGASPPVASPPPAPPADPATVEPAPGGPWRDLDVLAGRAAYRVSARVPKSSYRVGESLAVEVEVPSDGFLNVLNVGRGDAEVVVLFPNRYRPDNAVRGGETVNIPGPGELFELAANLPPGRERQQTLIVVVHTRHAVSAYESGSGEGFLRTLSPNATRAFAVAAAPASRKAEYGAGRLSVEVVR